MRFHGYIFILCIFFTIILFAEGFQLTDLDFKNQNKKPDLNISKYSIPQAITNGYSTPAGTVNIIILGLDGEEVRSDTIVFLNFNKATGSLNMLSIPRDTKVNTIRGFGKFNSLIGMGGESYVMDKVSELTGLPVDYYITMNYKGFRQIIDVLGGVEVNIKRNMDYDDDYQNLHIHLKMGINLLDGNKAEQYVRYRKGNRYGVGYTFGDLSRVEVQQNFIISIIKQKAKLKYIDKLDEVFKLLKQYVKTNIELKDTAMLYDIYKKLKTDEIKSYMLPGESTYINKVWYYVYNPEKTRSILESFYK